MHLFDVISNWLSIAGGTYLLLLIAVCTVAWLIYAVVKKMGKKLAILPILLFACVGIFLLLNFTDIVGGHLQTSGFFLQYLNSFTALNLSPMFMDMPMELQLDFWLFIHIALFFTVCAICLLALALQKTVSAVFLQNTLLVKIICVLIGLTLAAKIPIALSLCAGYFSYVEYSILTAAISVSWCGGKRWFVKRA